MKKVFKNPIIMFILGALIFSSGTVFAYSLIASDVSFTPKDSSWEVENTKEAIDDLHKKVNCNNDMIGTTWDYNYSGQEILFVTPCKGTYKLETWGAQGGDIDNNLIGGYGGYSVGKINLKNRYKLYINVGGQGVPSGYYANKTAIGGYNGGGNGYTDSGTPLYASSGGGATHIASKSGKLFTLENNKNNVIIVSGGGGGQWFYRNEYRTTKIGHGGGFKGVTSIGYSGTDKKYYSVLGGTQSINSLGSNYSIGSFGKGADNGGGSSPGAGGGWYGGGTIYAAASGGSGYIGYSNLKEKHMTCYDCETSNDENTKTIVTTNVSENPTSDYAKMGNGYARITLISID